MPIIQFMQDPLRISADFVASTTTKTRGFIQNHFATAASTTTDWFPPTITIKAITTVESFRFKPIQTLVTSLLYRQPLDALPTLANPTPTNAIGKASTNVDPHLWGVSKFRVPPYHLMYIVAGCVCFVILMSFCCCTDDIGRYIKSKNKAGATVQAAPVWPAALQFMDGANDTRQSNGKSRGLSSFRSSIPQPEESNSPGPSTIPRNPFTKITIKTCEEGHDSIIIDEIELRDIFSENSRCGLSNSNPDFNHEYITTNPQAYTQNGKVSLRGGSGTQGDLSDSFMRTGAITSFKQTEERWKPTWSAAKSLFSTRRRESESTTGYVTGNPISEIFTHSDSTYSASHANSSHQKASTNASKRAIRQPNTSGTAFSFPLSDGSDSEIPRFPTINRIKKKLKPLIHSVSKQTLRGRFSSADHSKDQSADETGSDGLAYSNTVQKALRRARSSASIPFGLFKLPDPARDDPGPSAAGPVSIMTHHSGPLCSDTSSENTARARSPVSTLLGVNCTGEFVSDSGSVYKSRSSRRVVVPLGSYEGVVDEVGLGAARAFSNLRSYEMKREMKREMKKEMVALKLAPVSERESKNQSKQEDEDEEEEENHLGVSRDNKTKEESDVTCRSINSSQDEPHSRAIYPEQEQSDAQIPSYMNSTRSGHVKKERVYQTAMTNHFHARRPRAITNSIDSSETFVATRMERMKKGLGLLMIRRAVGDNDGEGGGLGAKRGGKVEWVTLNLGSDD